MNDKRDMVPDLEQVVRKMFDDMRAWRIRNPDSALDRVRKALKAIDEARAKARRAAETQVESPDTQLG